MAGRAPDHPHRRDHDPPPYRWTRHPTIAAVPRRHRRRTPHQLRTPPAARAVTARAVRLIPATAITEYVALLEREADALRDVS